MICSFSTCYNNGSTYSEWNTNNGQQFGSFLAADVAFHQKYLFSLHILGFGYTVPSSCVIGVWTLATTIGIIVFALLFVGMCVLPSSVWLLVLVVLFCKGNNSISSPIFFSLPSLALLTEDVVSATESRWFAILSDSRAEAKPSPTAPMRGIKSC